MPLHIGSSLKLTPSSKAEALNQQFYSVFTKENNGILIMNSMTYPAMNNTVFSVNRSQSLLQNLEPDSISIYLHIEVVFYTNST